MLKAESDKNFQCNVCHRGFTRIDHLKRHHLRHSGVKPYSCVFCSEAFARCDNLRDHYTECPQRGGLPIPETGQRGRRRHACESCTSMKLRCDGQSPCDSCTKRKLKCNNVGKQAKPKNERPKPTEVASHLKNEELESSDRGSIRFLLNAGTDSFTEEWRLPPRSDRARGMQYHTRRELEEATNTLNLNVGLGPDFDDLAPFEENFMTLLPTPLPEPQTSLSDHFTDNLSAHPTILPSQDPKIGMDSDASLYESQSSVSSALIQAILAKTWTTNMDSKTQQEVSSNLHFLLTTRRIQKFVSLYFQHWHRNSNMIHVPSFNLEEVPLPLLVSVIFMGAMYSNNDREGYVSRRLLDLAELYVFSTDVFSCEHEVSHAFVGQSATDAERMDWLHFQSLQGGFFMVVTQYWAGSKAARNRVMESRYSEVVQGARRMGLPKCRHLPEDCVHETLWIQKECRIRFMNIIGLLDGAFYFYSNFPCRVPLAELECDLPCEDSFFASKHPFAQPNFRFTRDATVYEAFLSLFQNEQTASSSGEDTHHNQRNLSLGTSFTVMDMFLFIHMLHSYIGSYISHIAPIIRLQHNDGTSQQSSSYMPDDPVFASIRHALTRWRVLWVNLRSRIPADEWAAMGFNKNAYKFWPLAYLLITKKQSIDIIMQMEVKCEDKLEKLKGLLQDDND